MGAPVALRAPRAFRLPRVKFKKPRWPKGSRLYLGLTVFWAGLFVIDVVTHDFSVFGVPWDCGFGAHAGYSWWRSRRDDDGPSAT